MQRNHCYERICISIFTIVPRRNVRIGSARELGTAAPGQSIF
jgi:hypothetical protein